MDLRHRSPPAPGHIALPLHVGGGTAGRWVLVQDETDNMDFTTLNKMKLLERMGGVIYAHDQLRRVVTDKCNRQRE